MIRAMTFIAFMLVYSSSVFAQPEVIADFGGRVTDFPKKNQIKQKLLANRSLSENIVLPKASSHFPIRSDLTVGVVESVKHSYQVITPMFIVGVDSLSIEWLVTNKAHLKAIGAKGIVTNVPSQEAMDFIKARAPELTLNALPIDDIASLYGISHYPVLIDKEDIKQ